jgi:hypothetical protein
MAPLVLLNGLAPMRFSVSDDIIIAFDVAMSYTSKREIVQGKSRADVSRRVLDKQSNRKSKLGGWAGFAALGTSDTRTGAFDYYSDGKSKPPRHPT